MKVSLKTKRNSNDTNQGFVSLRRINKSKKVRKSRKKSVESIEKVSKKSKKITKILSPQATTFIPKKSSKEIFLSPNAREFVPTKIPKLEILKSPLKSSVNKNIRSKLSSKSNTPHRSPTDLSPKSIHVKSPPKYKKSKSYLKKIKLSLSDDIKPFPKISLIEWEKLKQECIKKVNSLDYRNINFSTYETNVNYWNAKFVPGPWICIFSDIWHD